jgi:hypothetical protein
VELTEGRVACLHRAAGVVDRDAKIWRCPKARRIISALKQIDNAQNWLFFSLALAAEGLATSLVAPLFTSALPGVHARRRE